MQMTIYLIVIFSLVSSVASIVTAEKLAEKILYVSIGFVLILIAGFRLPGLDYSAYVDIFNGNISKIIDPAILGISFILKSIYTDPIMLFVFFAILGVSLKLIAIRQLTNLLFLSLLLYISYYFIYHEMIQIRAGIASGFLLLSIKPIYERNLKLFVFFGILALSFHISALVIIPLWFLNPKKLNKNVYFLMVIFAYLLTFSHIYITDLIKYIPIRRIQILYEGYIYGTQHSKHSDEINIFSAILILRIFVNYFIVYFMDSILKHNKYIILLVKIYSISIASFILLSNLPVLAFRITQLLGVVEIVIIPTLIYAFKKNARIIAVFLPILIGWFMLLLNVFYRRLLF